MSNSEMKVAEVTTRHRTLLTPFAHNAILPLTPNTHTWKEESGRRSLSSMAAGKNSLFSRETENSVPLVQTLTGVLGPITHSHQRDDGKKKVKKDVFKIKISATGFG